MRSLHLALASATVCAALAGCSRSSSEDPSDVFVELTQVESPIFTPTAASQSRRAIDLLTEADLCEITNKTLARRTATSGTYINAAELELSGGHGVDASIVLGIMTSGGRTYFAKCASEAASATVPHLGDGAISPETDHIIAVQGDTLIDVQYIGIAPAQPGVVNRLVERIFSRLQ